jgi:hypothetical protein
MKLHDLVVGIDGFDSWTHVDKISLFAWYLHIYCDCDRLRTSQVKSCYDELCIDKPSNFSDCLSSLMRRKPKIISRDDKGYYLVRSAREEFNATYGSMESTVRASSALLDLPDKISNLAEQIFLKEAIICFRHGAFRAAIVMTWNLAFDHLCDHIVGLQLKEFNAQVAIRLSKNPNFSVKSISKKEDFENLKEFDVVAMCKSANIISNSVGKILHEKLAKRNMAAHPSDVFIEQIHAEEFIIDLVNNVVLKLD